jgi:FAD binding domain/D-arabinono-1,4-lactone oxidase
LADVTVTNWFGDLVSHPKAVVEAASIADVVSILKNPGQYPLPVRAIGSNHSTERCGVADGGTVVKMSGMNRILEISNSTVTVQAGALYIDIANELQKQGLQFYVNTEIGSITAGSAACCGTKDASMPGEFGQVGSYVSRIKMVLPSGDVLEVTDEQPDLMQKVRSSYGTFGIVSEVTFRVRAIQPLAVHHETYNIQDFATGFPALLARGESLMFYLFPYDNLVTVEFRHYNPGASGSPNRTIWPLRNYLWATAGPAVCKQISADIDNADIRDGVLGSFNALWRLKLENLIRSDNTIATDQIIRYPTNSNSKYTFSFWAFPEETYPVVLAAFFEFAQKYLDTTGYRINMLCVGYRVAKDQSSLLSYSYNGNMITIDPVSTANPGWTEFLGVYNQFCGDRGGVPLMNQTFGLTRAMVQKALGDRLLTFAQARQTFDPGGRLLNDYFRDLLAAADSAANH